MNKTIVTCLGVALALGVASVRLTGQPAAEGPLGTLQPLDPHLRITTEPLWTGAVPHAKGHGPLDTPTLTVFLPPPGRENGTAVIVDPGGAYLMLASDLEGREVANWFTTRGVTAFVLHYRLGARYLYPIPLEDAQRAVRWVRYYAPLYHLSKDRIGMVGFSAGGHLAAMTGTVGAPGNPQAADPIDRVSSRLNYMVLGYPWLNAMERARPTFIPSYETLMKIPEARWKTYAEHYTPATLVTAKTPPTFIYCTADDHVVPVQADLRFFGALVAHGVPAEMHIFRHGNHGSGLGGNDPSLDQWPNLLLAWLRGEHLLTPEPTMAAAIKAARQHSRRKPGEPFTLDSSLGAVLHDAAGRAAVFKWLGQDFIKKLPEAAESASLRTVLDYRRPPLSPEDLKAMETALAKAGRSEQ